MHATDNTPTGQLSRSPASVSAALQTSPEFGVGFFSARWHATTPLAPTTRDRRGAIVVRGEVYRKAVRRLDRTGERCAGVVFPT